MSDGGNKAFADKVWDVATKILVPLSIVLGTAIINHETRISSIEQEHARDHQDVQRLIERMDRLIDRLEVIGNRLTALETTIKK